VRVRSRGRSWVQNAAADSLVRPRELKCRLRDRRDPKPRADSFHRSVASLSEPAARCSSGVPRRMDIRIDVIKFDVPQFRTSPGETRGGMIDVDRRRKSSYSGGKNGFCRDTSRQKWIL